MPVYDYDCAACGRRIEVVHGVHAPGPTSCPNCGGGPLRKAITAPAVHFKGSGWAKRDRRATVSAGSAKSSDEGASSDGGSSEPASKPDGAPETKTEAPATPSPATSGGTGTATKTD